MEQLLRAKMTQRWRVRRLGRQPAPERWAKDAEVAPRTATMSHAT
jgi:hypothetical protein